MRISDWSSDVCSSDLPEIKPPAATPEPQASPIRDDPGLRSLNPPRMRSVSPPARLPRLPKVAALPAEIAAAPGENPNMGSSQSAAFPRACDIQIGRASCRERVCQYV